MNPNTADSEAAELASTVTMAETNDTDIETPDNGDQLDIDDAIANTKAEAVTKTGTHETIDLQDDGIVAAKTELAPSVTAKTEAEATPIGDSSMIQQMQTDAYGPPSWVYPSANHKPARC